METVLRRAGFQVVTAATSTEALEGSAFKLAAEVDVGEWFGNPDRYRVNAFCVPHPRGAVKDPVAQRERLRAWLAAWDRAAKKLDRPGVLLYTYLRDEPNDEEAYKFVQKWGRAVREANSAVKVLVGVSSFGLLLAMTILSQSPAVALVATPS